LQIVVTPSGRKWVARIGDRVICRSTWPFVMSARAVLAEGYPADAVIEMWHAGTDSWALRGQLGAVAAVRVDGEKAPYPARKGAPARISDTAAITVAGVG